MKALVYSLIIVTLSSCSMFDEQPTRQIPERNVPIQARNNGEPLKRVFVLPFVDATKQKSQDVISAARRVFVTALLKTGDFVVVKNTDFPKDLENFKTPSGDYDLEKIAAIAQDLGVNGVIEGSLIDVQVRHIGDDVGIVKKVHATVESKVRVRAFGSENKKELFNEVRSATEEATSTRFAESGFSKTELADDPILVAQSVQKAFYELIPALDNSMRKITWIGRIAMVQGEKIYINAGRASGIQVGDLLKVLDQGQDIYDPQTGTFLGHAEGRMKGTLEIVSYFGKDGAIGIVHSGADFKENDKVELY